MSRRRRYKGVMTNDCVVLLEWACKNGDRAVSLRDIEEETGIPDDTIRYILKDALEKKTHSLLYGVSLYCRIRYEINRFWNSEANMHRKKWIIHAFKTSDRERNVVSYDISLYIME